MSLAFNIVMKICVQNEKVIATAKMAFNERKITSITKKRINQEICLDIVLVYGAETRTSNEGSQII